MVLCTEHVCSPKIRMLKPNPQGDDSIKWWGLWEVIRHEGADLMNGINALIEDSLESSRTPCHVRTQ